MIKAIPSRNISCAAILVSCSIQLDRRLSSSFLIKRVMAVIPMMPAIKKKREGKEVTARPIPFQLITCTLSNIEKSKRPNPAGIRKRNCRLSQKKSIFLISNIFHRTLPAPASVDREIPSINHLLGKIRKSSNPPIKKKLQEVRPQAQGINCIRHIYLRFLHSCSVTFLY